MPGTVTIEFNSAGFRELLTSSGVGSDISSRTDSIEQSAGPGYSSRTFIGGYGGGRWIGIVYTDSIEAIIDESRNRTLERSIGAGRL